MADSFGKIVNVKRFVRCFVLVLIVTNCCISTRLPLNARVSSVKVIFLSKTEENSLVPKISVENYIQVVLTGENLVEGLTVALTKNFGLAGEACEPEYFVSPYFHLHEMENNVNNSVKLALSPPLTKKLSDLRDIWMCLSESDNDSVVNESSKIKAKPIWVHQGEASKIHIENQRRQNYLSPKLHSKSFSSLFKKFTKRASKRSLRDRSRRSVIEGRKTPLLDSSNFRKDRGTTSKFEPFVAKVNFVVNDSNEVSDDRTSSEGPVMDLGFRTSGGHSGFRLYLDDEGNGLNLPDETAVANSTFWSLSDLLEKDDNDEKLIERRERNINGGSRESATPENSLSSDFPILDSSPTAGVRVHGMRVESHARGFVYDDGAIELLAGYDAEIRLFGEGLTKDVSVQFTAREDDFGGPCDVSTSDVFQLDEANDHWAVSKIRLPVMARSQRVWFLCIRVGMDNPAVHQGREKWLTISTYSLLMPIWLQVIMLVILLILSGLFSGLNLGLMALDKTELKIVMNTGTQVERDYAKAIEPVRRHGNFLLCTLLLGNVLVNSTLTILLDTLSSGLIAVIGSTIGIVIFGEIVPQAICSRHGLAIGAKTAWLVRIFMVITGVVSWPISKILDLLLGEEIGSTYDRERLKELIRVTQDRNDLGLDEQNIIYGALEFHRKTVGEVMTKLDDVFMLSIDRSLDFNTINEIMQQGYSRIPIYEGERTNIVSVMLIKDLAFIDPDDNTPLRTLSQFYQNVCNFVFEDTTLDIIFKEFKEGNKGHMAFVQRVNNEGEYDPFYEVIGLVTLEDVIEELIQGEIVDETDVFTDNKTKRRRKHLRRDFKEFSQINHPNNHKKVQISPQMQVAAFQYLRTSVEPFKEGSLSEGILKRMLNQDIIHVIKHDPSNPTKQNIFMQGKPVDFFVLILEGHVEVTIGKENLTFESGPFTYFGLIALSMTPVGESPSLSTQLSRSSIVGSVQSLDSTKSCFTPDYSVKAATEVTFLKVRRSHYIAARRAYILEQCQKDPLAEETFDLEVEKILRDESLTSPVWENDLDRDSANKTLLEAE